MKSDAEKYGITDPENQKIIEKLNNVNNKQAYIRRLILEDIAKNGIQGT